MRIINDYRFLTSARTGPGLLPSPELIFETFRDEFDVAYEEGTLLVLTLHPHVVGMRSRIIYLDRAGSLHQGEAGRLVRDGRADRALRQAAGRRKGVRPTASATRWHGIPCPVELAFGSRQLT